MCSHRSPIYSLKHLKRNESRIGRWQIPQKVRISATRIKRWVTDLHPARTRHCYRCCNPHNWSLSLVSLQSKHQRSELSANSPDQDCIVVPRKNVWDQMMQLFLCSFCFFFLISDTIQYFNPPSGRKTVLKEHCTFYRCLFMTKISCKNMCHIRLVFLQKSTLSVSKDHLLAELKTKAHNNETSVQHNTINITLPLTLKYRLTMAG